MADKQYSMRISEDRLDELKVLSQCLEVSSVKLLSALIRSYWKYMRDELKADGIPEWVDELLGINTRKKWKKVFGESERVTFLKN